MGNREYHKRKSKERYELDKKLSKEYRLDFGSNMGKTFTEFKKERKKHLGK